MLEKTQKYPFFADEHVETRSSDLSFDPPVFSGVVIGRIDENIVIIRPHMPVRDRYSNFQLERIAVPQARLVSFRLNSRGRIPTEAELWQRIYDEDER